MIKLTPIDDNVIVKIIETEAKIGSIIVSSSAKEKSTLAEVMIPAERAYHRDGTLMSQPRLKAGMRVRIPSGNVGTGVPEAPEGETWLCLPEDAVYYIIEDISNG